MAFTVSLFFRKPRNLANFSIELYFKEIVKYIPAEKFTVFKREASFESKGFINRILICTEAFFKQSKINHITGDIHFVALLLSKPKTILTIHDCWFMRHPSAIARFLFKWFWLKIPIARVKIITAVSQATKQEIIKFTGCDSNKIRVIPTAIPSFYKPQPKIFNTVKPTILHIGNADNKNLERLIIALEGIACTLNIIGKLSNNQLTLLTQHNIDYTNSYNISNDEMYLAYCNCDLLAFVSTFEGFGMPIIEANSVERVVLTANISSMPEVASNAALLVDPYSVASIKNGILQLIKDDNLRQELIDNGRKNKMRFEPTFIAQQYAQLYMEIINSNQN